MPSTNELGERWLRDVAIELATEWPHGPTPDPEGLQGSTQTSGVRSSWPIEACGRCR